MFVAGEASGDLHAAELFRAIKQRRPGIQAFGFGGARLAAAGVKLEYDLVSHAVIGVVEALAKLQDFFKALRFAESLMRQRRPDVVVLTDFPDFNFRVAALAKRLGIPVVYYISPQVWAWRRGRVKTMKQLVDRMLVVFPFEEPIYQAAGIPVTFVGHPLLDLAKPESDVAARRKQLLGKSRGPLVALLPGSRAQEIEMLLPDLAQTGRLLQAEFPGMRFILPLARTVSRERVEAILREKGLAVTLVTEKPYAARAAADLALVASGTATLETAILGTPLMVVYRMKASSYWLARWFVKLPYFGLANLAAGRQIAPEFLQQDVEPVRLAAAAAALLRNPAALAEQRRGWQQVRRRLGGSGAAGRAAREVISILG